MELFRYNPDDAPADVYRMLSSSSTGWHSWLLDKGSHTHNTTTFTRPGRYVVTYRTVARSTDGRIISSKPSKLVWQVGRHAARARVTAPPPPWPTARPLQRGTRR